MMIKKSISVAICTYNGALFLKEQIDSILNQTLAVDEIIVCDDVSTDATIEILNEYKTNYPFLFKIIRNETTLKSVKNFEKALLQCTGDILFLADQDDKWELTKVERFLSYFDKNPTCNVLASNGYCIDEKSVVHDKYTVWDVPSFLEEINISYRFYDLIVQIGNFFTGATMALRASFLKEVIPFPILQNFHHDEWIALIAAHDDSLHLLNKKLIYYRIHENQQVGGVFAEKTLESKKSFIKHFNINALDLKFRRLERKIHNLTIALSKTKAILQSNVRYPEIFEKNAIHLENEIASINTIMKRKHPIKYFLRRFKNH